MVQGGYQASISVLLEVFFPWIGHSLREVR